MIPPSALRRELPLGPETAEAIGRARAAVLASLRGEDPRLLLIVGPCSLHDARAAREYASRLATLSASIGARPEDRGGGGSFLIVLRAYVEKSRSGAGWRGMAEEPGITGGRDPERGARVSRSLLVELASLGLPLGIEIVSPYSWRYWMDCVSWAAFGARSVESQVLRETAALLPVPAAFKNGLAGSLEAPIEAARLSSSRLRILAMDEEGRVAALDAPGNPLPHLALRGVRRAGLLPGGGRHSAANFGASGDAARGMAAAGLLPAILLDASHDNAAGGRLRAWRKAQRRAARDPEVRGLMLESNLESGRQDPADPAKLRYGVSITDPCLGWEETERLIREAQAYLQPRLRARGPARKPRP